MVKKNIGVMIDEQTYKKFKDVCLENGYSISGRIEILIKRDIYVHEDL